MGVGFAMRAVIQRVRKASVQVGAKRVAEGKLNCSLLEVGGEALVVSQFTLYGNVRKGLRPSFDQAADPTRAKALHEKLIDNLISLSVKTSAGVFQTRMLVTLENDGPVTLIVESPSGR